VDLAERVVVLRMRAFRPSLPHGRALQLRRVDALDGDTLAPLVDRAVHLAKRSGAQPLDHLEVVELEDRAVVTDDKTGGLRLQDELGMGAVNLDAAAAPPSHEIGGQHGQ